MSTHRIFTEILSYPANNYIGNRGNIFYSPDTSLRISDGETVGGQPLFFGSFTFPKGKVVSQLSDFPDPIDGVIYLEDNTEYCIRGTVDIGNNRFQCGVNQAFRGSTTELSFLINNVDNEALLNSNSTIIAESLTFTNSGVNGKAVNAESTSGDDIITFKDINIVGCEAGLISNYRNVLFLLHAHINCTQGWSFDKIFRSIVFDTVATVNNTELDYTFCNVLSTADIQSRLRAVMSNFIVNTGTICFNIADKTSLQSEGFQLVNNQFSGSGSYISGATQSDNETWFALNGGLRDTKAFVQMVLQGSTSPTVLSNTSWTKAVANTTPNGTPERFTHTSNRVTYTGSKERTITINGHCTVSGQNADAIKLNVVKNGSTVNIEAEASKITLPATGRFEVVPITTYVRLQPGDYIELWVANETAGRNITIEKLNLVISETGI